MIERTSSFRSPKAGVVIVAVAVVDFGLGFNDVRRFVVFVWRNGRVAGVADGLHVFHAKGAFQDFGELVHGAVFVFFGRGAPCDEHHLVAARLVHFNQFFGGFFGDGA